jgi:membrane-bound lytic murein transglycosylase A
LHKKLQGLLYICIKAAILEPPSMLKNGRYIVFFCGMLSLLSTCQHNTSVSVADVLASISPDSNSVRGSEKALATAAAAPKVATSVEKANVVVPVSKRKLPANVLIPAIPDTMPYIPFDPTMLQALYEQINYLERTDVSAKGVSGITKGEMLKTVQKLQEVQLLDPSVLLQAFDFYQLNTELKKDKVRITGYYTPLVKASRTRTGEFSVPLLKKPDSGIPSPAAIESGALSGRNLELAWVSSKKELRNAQLQGSCLIEFTDGAREHYGFGGSVKGSGGTYVFFTKVDNRVLGAGFFPLTAGYSVAVDPKYIPIGSVLFAELPQMDAAGNLKGYTYRILFAQDRGGAIKTTKRLDLYSGVGQHGLHEARKINGYGRLWLMLPKQDHQPPGAFN